MDVIYTILCVNHGLQRERYVIFIKWSVFFNIAVIFWVYVASVVIDEYLGMDYWNDIDKENEVLGKESVHFHFTHHKSHMMWLRLESI